jgi:hypothetical protein
MPSHRHLGPGRFLACVAMMEAAGQDRPRRVKNGRCSGPQDNGAAVPSFDDEEPRRLQRVTLRESVHLACIRAGDPGSNYAYNVPSDARVVDKKVNESQRGIDFVIYSEDFPEVAEGKPIPELNKGLRR